MLIELTIRTKNLEHAVSELCKVAEVSRSGYYDYLKASEKRNSREESDLSDYELISKIFEEKKGKAGAKTVKMILENDYSIIMNLKKIHRLMNKYGLITKVRRPNPYKKMAKANQEHKTLPNLLKRQFDQQEPGKVLLTDITYLYHGNGKPAYLSAVRDGATREILAYELSPNLKMDFTFTTLRKLEESLEGCMHPEGILHSDQGFHYTHPNYQLMVKEMGLTQSMSRKGNCWDNASMESFFGHLKDEVDFADCQNFEELKQLIDTYIFEYNSHRYQWDLKKMTPEQYRGHLLAS